MTRPIAAERAASTIRPSSTLNGDGAAPVAVIGAGPYGLATASRLAQAGIRTRVFGDPMSFWRDMPKGMLLRSNWKACNIADTEGPLSLGMYERHIGGPLSRPVPLDDFVRYGDWFQQRAVPHVENRTVEQVESHSGGFSLGLADGEEIAARRIVVAAGIEPFARRPPELDGLAARLASHTSQHRDLGVFRGRRLLIVGGGQSALESAALARESGAEVEVVVRRDRLTWLTGARTRRMLGRLTPIFYSPTDVGPAGMSRIVSVPDLFRHFPRRAQDRMARRAIRPAGAAWLPARLTGVAISLGTSVVAADADGDAVRVTTSDGRERTVDHVLFGTGYAVDVRRYPFLSPSLASRIVCANGYPVLRRGLESSVTGLHFAGAPAAWSFGPLMRFVSGTWYASRQIAGRIATESRR
jgi:cation diffusion facilitator CzcD-associated flavoprotein CzcO